MIRVCRENMEVRGWDAVSVGLSLSTICNGFSLSQFSAEDLGSPVLFPGDVVKVYYEDELLIDGFVDATGIGFSSGNHRITIDGREKTGDLVDCSLEDFGVFWKDKTVAVIVSDICAAFGIRFDANGVSPGAKLTKFCPDPGNTCLDDITAACRQRDLLCTSLGDGVVRFYDASKYTYADDVLEEGVNVLVGDAKFSHSDRFSAYTVLGSADPKSKRKGLAYDTEVKRKRPLVMVDADYGTVASAEQKAAFEAQTRAAQSATCSVTVHGFRQKTGARKIWRPGMLVTCKIPKFFGEKETEMLINSVELGYDLGSGEMANLELVRPDFYKQPAKTSGKIKPTATNPWADIAAEVKKNKGQ